MKSVRRLCRGYVPLAERCRKEGEGVGRGQVERKPLAEEFTQPRPAAPPRAFGIGRHPTDERFLL